MPIGERPAGRQVDLIAAANTDGLIAARDLVVVEDDLHYFPPYDAVPIVRQECLQSSPEIAGAMRRLTGRLSAQEMRRLNFAIDGEKKDVAVVVREFLQQKKFFAECRPTPEGWLRSCTPSRSYSPCPE